MDLMKNISLSSASLALLGTLLSCAPARNQSARKTFVPPAESASRLLRPSASCNPRSRRGGKHSPLPHARTRPGVEHTRRSAALRGGFPLPGRPPPLSAGRRKRGPPGVRSCRGRAVGRPRERHCARPDRPQNRGVGGCDSPAGSGGPRCGRFRLRAPLREAAARRHPAVDLPGGPQAQEQSGRGVARHRFPVTAGVERDRSFLRELFLLRARAQGF